MIKNAKIHIISYNFIFDDVISGKLSGDGHNIFTSFSESEAALINADSAPDIYIVTVSSSNIRQSFLFLSENEHTIKIPVVIAVSDETYIEEKIHDFSTCMCICRLQDADQLYFNVTATLKHIHKSSGMIQNIPVDNDSFYELTHNIEDAIWITELNDFEKVIIVNHSFEKIFGRQRYELLANPLIWLDAIVEGDIGNVTEEYEIFKSTRNGRFQSTFRIFDKDRNIKWIHARCWKTLSHTSAPVRITMLAQDITQQIYFHEDLRIKNYAIESAVTGITLSNSYGRIFFANNTFLSMWNFRSESDIIGHSIIDLLENAKDREFIIETILKLGGWIGEISAIRSDGSTFPAQVSLTMVTDEYDDPTAIMASFIDISEMKQAQAEITRNLEEKKYLLSELQHRVKNSLNIVSSLIGFEISKGRADISDLQKIRSRIYSISLLYSTLDTEYNFTEINVCSYVSDIINGLRESYIPESKKISILLDCENFSIDPHLSMSTGLIVNEIITNSLKHAFNIRLEGEIKVNIRKIGSNMMINISNNGDDFPENFSIIGSKGLGMKIVTMLTEQHKGKFEFISRNNPGFKITIPLFSGEIPAN